MLARHRVYCSQDHLKASVLAQFPNSSLQQLCLWQSGQQRMLRHFVAGSDAFSKESNGITIARQYQQYGLRFSPAYAERVAGWSAVSDRFGSPATGIKPKLFIHPRCKRLIETLPNLQHDPDRPGDILKSNINEEGLGGDDCADALRYLVATPIRRCYVRKLTGA